MTHPPDYDAPVCEFRDCRNSGWVVLHFGPKKTPPRRVACHGHQSETDLSQFRNDGDPDEKGLQ